jgi:ribosomal protein L16 Arg81 hydroxylase
MTGVIAENHYDASRNAIALLGGSRRYILTHPDQCDKLALYPMGHPSARHSAVDWSDPDLNKFPEFADAKVNEVVLSAGQVLYLPDEYFHYIISLEMNYQCNTRSGITRRYKEHIHRCGFP